MDSSRRAVELYWRSRMIDAATADEDKVAPVYKLEEICDLLRSSHVSVVKEVSDFILKRLDHKSPIVKQKALRLIKYAVGKSGVEFRREMQRHSAAVRQLFHYKGQPNPLRGDALNKAVRDTAHEAIAAIFSEENKPAPAENINKRIQGFGNKNFETPSDDRKSFLSEVVGIGSASIKQGLNSFTQVHSLRKNDIGSYKSPNLHKSLTTGNEHSDKYEPVRLPNDIQGSFGVSKDMSGGPWGQGFRGMNTETKNGDSSSSTTEMKTREGRLLETIVTSGGIRLQPTRDAIQAFLLEAAKLDALALSVALESKLQSPTWQVRMKAACVLESILRKKDDEHFSTIACYFSENKDVVVRCSESPQTSLREKANKVLRLLDGEQVGSAVGYSKTSFKAETASVQMPDLIDTGDSNDLFGNDESIENSSDQKIPNQTTSARPLIDDLFGGGFGTCASTSEQKSDDDPFADISSHTSEGRQQLDNIFSGMTFDGKPVTNENHTARHKIGPEQFDVFGSSSELSGNQDNHKTEINDLISGMSIDEKVPKTNQQGSSPGLLENTVSDSCSHLGQVSNGALSSIFCSQLTGINSNPMFSSGTMPYNMPPSTLPDPAFHSQPINYGAMGSLLAHQQFLVTMSNFQHLSNLNGQNAGANLVAGTNGVEYSSPLPDIFQSNFPSQVPTLMMNSSKKEETRAFDFISDHIAANCDPKRVA